MPAIASTPELAIAPTVDDHSVPKPLWRNPRALNRSWSPSTLVGREDVLGRLETAVLAGLTPGGHVIASVSGPRGSGSSAVAAHLGATAKDRLARPGAKGVPLVLRVDLSAHRSPNAVVSALFRGIDPDVNTHGVSTEYLSLLLLRRLRGVGRPSVIWLDQVQGATGDLWRVLGPLTQPERTLPEGSQGIPTMLVVVSGERDPLPPEVDAVRTQLTPLQGLDLGRAIMTRANAAFNAPPSLDAVAAIANLSVARGWGLSMVGELLGEAGRRAEARGGRWLELEDVAVPSGLKHGFRGAEPFQALLLKVLGVLAGPTQVGKLRQVLTVECRDAGVPLPSASRLWRHLVRLEEKGLVQREVRLGGKGGTNTRITLSTVPSLDQEEL